MLGCFDGCQSCCCREKVAEQRNFAEDSSLKSRSLHEVLVRFSEICWESKTNNGSNFGFPWVWNLLYARNLPARRELIRFQRILQLPEFEKETSEVRQNWFQCFTIFAQLEEVARVLDHRFLVPYLRAKEDNSPLLAQSFVNRAVRIRELEQEVIECEKRFAIGAGSYWAFREAMCCLKRTFTHYLESKYEWLECTERALPLVLDRTEEEVRLLFGTAMSNLMDDSIPSMPSALKQAFLARIYSHLCGANLQGMQEMTDVLPSNLQKRLVSELIPGLESAYLKPLFGLVQETKKPKRAAAVLQIFRRKQDRQRRRERWLLQYAHACSKLQSFVHL